MKVVYIHRGHPSCKENIYFHLATVFMNDCKFEVEKSVEILFKWYPNEIYFCKWILLCLKYKLTEPEWYFHSKTVSRHEIYAKKTICSIIMNNIRPQHQTCLKIILWKELEWDFNSSILIGLK
jgi:hypothetical protein